MRLARPTAARLVVVRLIPAVLVLSGAAPPAAAQTPPPAGLVQPVLLVGVSHTGQDDVGLSFVRLVKEALAQSGRYVVAPEETAHLALHLSTINPFPSKPGVQSVVGWSVTIPQRGDAYLSGGVQSFGADTLKPAAQALFESVDTLATRHREELPGSAEAAALERAWRAAVDEAAETVRFDARRTLFAQHMDLQLRVWRLSGYVLPADPGPIVRNLASEYDEPDSRLLTDDLAACRTELGALKKAGVTKK